MAAHMSRGNFHKLLSSCVTLKNLPNSFKGNLSMRCMFIVTASLHTQRKIARQSSVFVHQLLKGNSQIYLRAPVLSARWNSSSSAEGSGFINPPTDYIPPIPSVPVPEPVSASSELIESLNALGEPTLQSLGLGSLWPSGLYQQLLETIHVSVGLPWWGSIILVTCLLRTCMFPLVIKSQKASISMANHMPTIQRLQEKFTKARQRGNLMEAAQYGGELRDYMTRNKVNPIGQMMVPMAQIPIFLSVFIGLRQMAYLPIESMKTGGILWFPDLTVASSLIGLPLMTSVTLWLTLEVGADGMNTNMAGSHVIKWIMRAMPIAMLPVIVNFPTAMLVYWFTSNTFSLCQVLFLKIPVVREFFNIPHKVKHPDMDLQKKPFLEGFKESYSNMKATSRLAERQRLDELNYRKAAQGPIVKTYSYNPKKVKGAPSIEAKSKSS